MGGELSILEVIGATSLGVLALLSWWVFLRAQDKFYELSEAVFGVSALSFASYGGRYGSTDSLVNRVERLEDEVFEGDGS